MKGASRKGGDYRIGRYLTMSTLCGYIELQRYLASNLNIGPVEAVGYLKYHLFDTASFDYDSALKLLDIVHTVPVFPIDDALRTLIFSIIEELDPWWAKLASLGREHVIAALSSDQVQCLESAGLLASNPDITVVRWWDALGAHARKKQNDNKLVAGRKGEQLTIEHESRRLREIGIEASPRWIALENNAAGYDVLSYDRGKYEQVNRLIEVKACSQYPLHIHISRLEWETCQQAKGSYVFHVWHLPSATLHEFSPSQLAAHIPVNQGDGKWESVEAFLSS